jgi:hypothetical protein
MEKRYKQKAYMIHLITQELKTSSILRKGKTSRFRRLTEQQEARTRKEIPADISL